MATTPDPLRAVASLGEPARRALYDVVAASPEALSRDVCARRAGMSRALAAFHLDKLVEAGLLAVEFRRVTGRSGPGAGRPSKLYRRAETQVSVDLPPRRYASAGHLLARAVEAAGPGGARAALDKVARSAGREMGTVATSRAGRRPSAARRLAEALAVLRDNGYEPFVSDAGEIRLHNCPFHLLASDHRQLVCGMNLALMRGLTEALELSGFQPVLAPEPGACCVVFRRKTR
jgi:predicted ArsR family transcriptional regulator